MSDTKTNQQFNTIEIIRLIVRYKIPIGVMTLLAIVASIIFSGPSFITPKYESTVIFYPSKNNSVSGGILEDPTAKEVDASEFGEEENAEQALQILASSQLQTRVVERFNLMEHYGIDPNGSMPYTKLGKEISTNIKFNRTEFLSIEISVMDESPQMAANIANGISQIYDSVRTEIQRQVSSKAFQIIENEYNAKIKEVEGLTEQVNALSSGKGIDATLLSGGKNEGTAQAVARQQKLAKSGADVGTLIRLTESLSQSVEQMNHLKEKYRKAKADMEEYIPHKFEISPAFAAEKKAYPTRFLIVLGATFGTFFFSVLFFILLERYKYLRQLIKED